MSGRSGEGPRNPSTQPKGHQIWTSIVYIIVTAVAKWAKSPVNAADRIGSDSIFSVDWAFSSVGNSCNYNNKGPGCDSWWLMEHQSRDNRSAVRPGRKWANARICLATIVASTIPKKLATIVRSRFERLTAIVVRHQDWRIGKSSRRGTCWNDSPHLRQDRLGHEQPDEICACKISKKYPSEASKPREMVLHLDS